MSLTSRRSPRSVRSPTESFFLASRFPGKEKAAADAAVELSKAEAIISVLLDDLGESSPFETLDLSLIGLFLSRAGPLLVDLDASDSSSSNSKTISVNRVFDAQQLEGTFSIDSTIATTRSRVDDIPIASRHSAVSAVAVKMFKALGLKEFERMFGKEIKIDASPLVSCSRLFIRASKSDDSTRLFRLSSLATSTQDRFRTHLQACGGNEASVESEWHTTIFEKEL